MLFILEPIPDTSAYMIAGYALAFMIMAIYVTSLVIRWRNLNRDLQTLESIQAESQPKVSEPKTTKPRQTAHAKRKSGAGSSKAPARKKK